MNPRRLLPLFAFASLSLAAAPQGKERVWYSGEVQHAGFPLMLRFPEKPDYAALQPKYPRLLVVKHYLEKVKSSGLPEADYNDSLVDFDHELIGQFEQDATGVPVLVETFAGKRNYYFYVSSGAAVERARDRIDKKYSILKLEWIEKNDQDWSFIRRYSDEYQFYKKE